MKQIIFLILSVLLLIPLASRAASRPTGLPPASATATGQTACYNPAGTVIPCAGTGQDGDWQMGAAWPAPRFTDNGNGTVTDKLTGLIWLKNANCFNLQTWANALVKANTLANGQCGLTDGTAAGQWRLPTVMELESLVDASRANPAIPAGHPFTSVQNSYRYSTSTTAADNTGYAWSVYMNYGNVIYVNKTDVNYLTFVWPVRGGL